MADFINTIDLLGDDAVVDSIINRTITEFKDNQLTKVGSGAFYGCTALIEVNLPNVCSSNGDSLGTSAFEGCTALQSVNLPSYDRAASAMTYQFRNCKALERIILPSLLSTSLGMFMNCTMLATVDLPCCTYLGGNVFAGCSALTALILRSTSVCSLANTNNAIANTPIAKGTGYVYVPRALVDSYKVATNWSTYATQFRALEDYTVDGTITGELDETKI